MERELGTNIWGHGFVNLRSLRGQKKQDKPIDNVGAYLVKYMTKDLYKTILSHNKLYLCSKGIKRPVVLTQQEAKDFYEHKNLGRLDSVFSNNYRSEYLGSITYKEFNLRR
ncbi:hypothetical protein ACEN32_11290 [Marinilactibacillus psychrotolerans]|uniref:hypothetical protein n=1 Tax=Marinilactibacillus psychrotolerans TaxID=191770 RepID=UPI00388774B9